MDQELFEALTRAGYKPSTALRYAQESYAGYPALRARLDAEEPLRRPRRSVERAWRIQQLIEAGYAPSTANVYASRQPASLPRKAQQALGFMPTVARPRGAQRARRTQALIEAGYSGSSAYSLAGRDPNKLPERARAALARLAAGPVLTPAQKAVRQMVRRKLGERRAAFREFRLDFPHVYLDDKKMLGGEHFRAWRELLLLVDPDSEV